MCPQEAAKAAAGLEVARCQVEHHRAAVEEAQKVHGDASAALVSLGLRCEGLADTLAAERSARQVRRSPLFLLFLTALRIGPRPFTSLHLELS